LSLAIGHDLRKQTVIRHAVPDPVVEPMAGMDVVTLAGNEIAEDAGAFVVGEAEVAVKLASMAPKNFARRKVRTCVAAAPQTQGCLVGNQKRA
jgi:hypothetical protein